MEDLNGDLQNGRHTSHSCNSDRLTPDSKQKETVDAVKKKPLGYFGRVIDNQLSWSSLSSSSSSSTPLATAAAAALSLSNASPAGLAAYAALTYHNKIPDKAMTTTTSSSSNDNATVTSPNGTTRHRFRYRILEIIGRGGFSTVYRADCGDDTDEVAIKIVNFEKFIDDKAKISKQVAALDLEIRILEKIRDDIADQSHILQIKEVVQDQSRLGIVMELLSGRELFDRIIARGFYTEADAAGVVRTVSMTLSKLHEIGIVHRDLVSHFLFSFCLFHIFYFSRNVHENLM